MNNRNLVVTSWVSLAIVAASVEPIIVKLGYSGSATPMQLLTVKTLMGALLILPLTRCWRWIGWRGLREVAVVSVLLLTTSALTLLALQHLSAVSVITIVTTTPAFVAMFNQKLGRDILGSKFWLGFAMCFAGVALGIDFRDLSFNTTGLLQIGGAVISSTLYRVRMEKTTAELSPALVSTYIFLINGIITTVFILPLIGHISPACWGIGAWIGLAAAAANVAFLYALSLLGSTRISIINMLQRPMIIIAAAMILKEPLSIAKIAGVALVLIGIQFASVTRKKAPSLALAGAASDGNDGSNGSDSFGRKPVLANLGAQTSCPLPGQDAKSK